MSTTSCRISCSFYDIVFFHCGRSDFSEKARTERGIGSVSHITTKMDRFKALDHRVANRLFKHTVWPVVRNGFVRSTKRIANINVQQQVSGNPHPPHGGNARGLPVFGRLTEPNTSHNFFMSPTFLFCWISIWGKLRLDNKRFEIKQKRIERESTTVRAENAPKCSTNGLP